MFETIIQQQKQSIGKLLCQFFQLKELTIIHLKNSKQSMNLCLGVITWRVGYFCGDLSPSKSSLFFDWNLICFLQSYMNLALTAQKTIFFVVDSPQNQGRWLEKNSHLPGPSSTSKPPPSHPRSLCLTSGPFSGFAGTTCPTLKTTASPHEISLFSHLDTDVKKPTCGNTLRWCITIHFHVSWALQSFWSFGSVKMRLEILLCQIWMVFDVLQLIGST